MSEQRVEPIEVVRLVDEFIDNEHRDATKYDNRSPLDESGALGLHRLAAAIYQAGHHAGEQAAAARFLAAIQRKREKDVTR